MTSKKPLSGNKRSHALNATKTMKKPNLVKVKLDNGETIRISAREKRTLDKVDKKNVDKVDKQTIEE